MAEPLVSETELKRRGPLSSKRVPLIDKTLDHPSPQVTTIENVIADIKSLAKDDCFQSHLQKKLKKNQMSFPIQPGDEITALTKMSDGFAVGLKNGKVMLVSPPISRILELHSEPIIGLFAASSFFIAAAAQSRVLIWNLPTDTPGKDITCEGEITCLTGNMVKEVIFIGLGNGCIEHHAIKKDKQQYLVQIKSRLHKAGEDSPTIDIKTNDSTTWLAARYQSESLIFWDHENDSLLYHLTFNAGPGLPTSWGLGDTINLPRFFKPDKGWDVYPEHLVFSSPLLIRMSGNHIVNLTNARRAVETDGSCWLAIGSSLRNGFFSLLRENTVVTFTKPVDTNKRGPAERSSGDVEIDLGLNFSKVERSEANNYLAFACPESLEVICLAAFETQFVHPLGGAVKLNKTLGFLYSRGRKFVNSQGEELLSLKPRERVMGISKDCQWAMCMVGGPNMNADRPNPETQTLERANSERPDADRQGEGGSSTFAIKHLRDSSIQITVPEPWVKQRIIGKCFSKDSKFAVLVFPTGVVCFSLSDKVPIYTYEKQFKVRRAKPKFTSEGGLLICAQKLLCIVDVVRQLWVDVPWEYQKICTLKKEPERVIAYSKTKTSYCKLTNEEFRPLEDSLDQGFDLVKALKPSSHCLGSNDSGVWLFSIPKFTLLLHIKSEYQVIASKSSQLLYAFCSESKSSAYGMMDVWDLNLGLKLQTVSSGLQHVLGNKLTVRGPGMWREPKMKRITVQDTSKALIRGSWILNLDGLAPKKPEIALKDGYQSREIELLEEQFELHCIALKNLATLMTIGELNSTLIHILIQPWNLNILHLLAHNSNAHLLNKALDSGTPILKSAFGSPLTLCIIRKSRKCVNALLTGLIELKEVDPTAFLTALYHIQDDLFRIVSFGSTALAEFLQLVLVPLPEEMFAKTVIKPKLTLPAVHLSENLWVDPTHYQVANATEDEKLTVEYLVSPFPVYIEFGSVQSIRALHHLTNNDKDMAIYKTLFVKTIINMKWKQLWPVIFTLTVIYWGLLGALIARMFKLGDQNVVAGVYFGLNTLFFLLEVWQATTALKEYLINLWNYVDIARFVLGYLWILTDQGLWLTFSVVFLSLLRGITYFQTFDATRFYVRMIFVVTKETMSFIWVFFYSTFAFGLLFASVEPDNFPGFFAAWMIPYEMNMGSFNVDDRGSWYWMVFMIAALVNVVIMLNLVVSILGDAFEKFQTIAEAADVLGKAEVLYEYELMMKWNRNSGTRKYIQFCRDEGSAETGDMWMGKVEELKKELKKVEGKLSNKLRSKVENEEDLNRRKELRRRAKQSEISSLLDEKVARLKSDLKSEISEVKKLIEDRFTPRSS